MANVHIENDDDGFSRFDLWRECDEGDGVYFIGAVLNPRRSGRFSPIPLSLTPGGIEGNFRIDWSQEFVEVRDELGATLGRVPVVVYGQGAYRPHPPSHFLEDIHVQEGNETHQPRQRIRNFRLAMDDS